MTPPEAPVTPLLPALLAAGAVWVLLLPGAGPARVRRLGGAVAAEPPVPALLPVAVLVAAASFGPVGAGAVLAGSFGARAAGRRAAATRAARAHSAALPDLCRALAAELRAGAPPAEALTRAAADAPPGLAAHLRRLATAGHLGTAPPPDAWPGPPGADRLRAVGALWSVAADAGAGLADGLDRLGEALAAEQRRRAEVAAQLAGPRASAVVLAALPAFGLLLGATLGADPLAFLTTPLGLACLAGAAALDATGVWWVRRLTAGAVP